MPATTHETALKSWREALLGTDEVQASRALTAINQFLERSSSGDLEGNIKKVGPVLVVGMFNLGCWSGDEVSQNYEHLLPDEPKPAQWKLTLNTRLAEYLTEQLNNLQGGLPLPLELQLETEPVQAEELMNAVDVLKLAKLPKEVNSSLKTAVGKFTDHFAFGEQAWGLLREWKPSI